MRRDPQSLTDYLQIIDQRRLYQEHVRHLLTAKPSIDTSPIPMNESIKEKQQQNAMNRVFKFQLEEDKLKFVNDLQEYNRLNKKTKKYLHPKRRSARSHETDTNLYSPRINSSQINSSTQNPLEQSSTLYGFSSSRRSNRKYPKLIEPKTPKKTRKVPMAVQTSNSYDEDNQYDKSKKDDDDIDIPIEYTDYLSKSNYSISVDEKAAFYHESPNKNESNES